MMFRRKRKAESASELQPMLREALTIEFEGQTSTEKAPLNRQLLKERIEKRALELWELEGRPEGRELEHWLRAEREITD